MWHAVGTASSCYPGSRQQAKGQLLCTVSHMRCASLLWAWMRTKACGLLGSHRSHNSSSPINVFYDSRHAGPMPMCLVQLPLPWYMCEWSGKALPFIFTLLFSKVVPRGTICGPEVNTLLIVMNLTCLESTPDPLYPTCPSDAFSS